MDVIYYYDGSFYGFLCCIFDSYAYQEHPAAISCDGDEIISLFDSRMIKTNPDHAIRVLRKTAAISKEAANLLRWGFLSCLPEKEMHLFHLVEKLLRDGPGFLQDRSDETLYPVARAVQHLNGEVHLLKGFVRFSNLGGILGGEIAPKNRVLSLLKSHFCARYHNECFFLYDRTHKEALFYAEGKAVIRPLDDFQMAPPDEDEVRYRTLWKRFYDTIAIRERYNPRLRMSNMPKRYWSTMTEFQGEDYFRSPSEKGKTPSQRAAIKTRAGVSGPGALTGIPEPGTPQESGPSAPESVP